MGAAIARSSSGDGSDFEEKKTRSKNNATAATTTTTPHNNNNISSPEDVVLQKITSSKQFQQKLGYNISKMRHFAKQISNVEELKNSYLSTDWLHTVQLYKEVSTNNNSHSQNGNDDGEGEEDELNGSSNNNNNNNNNNMFGRSLGLSSVGESSTSGNGGDFFNNLLLADQFEEIPEQELDSLKNLRFQEKIRIKLLIAETADTTSKRALRQLISPLLNSFNALPELGMFHSALIIGPWKLEFNDSGVVVPRKIISSAAVLTADIDHITTVNRFNDITNKLAEVITKWNTTMQYKETGGDKTKVGNCQDFVDDVLQTLDIKLNFTGPLARFIERLRKTGKCSLQFEPDQQFVERYGLTEKAYKFESHETLDLFVHGLLEKNPNMMTEDRSEWALLKSFDRAFWLKHNKFPERKEYVPLMSQSLEKYNCPFGDPSQFSFINM